MLCQHCLPFISLLNFVFKIFKLHLCVRVHVRVRTFALECVDVRQLLEVSFLLLPRGTLTTEFGLSSLVQHLHLLNHLALSFASVKQEPIHHTLLSTVCSTTNQCPLWLV